MDNIFFILLGGVLGCLVFLILGLIIDGYKGPEWWKCFKRCRKKVKEDKAKEALREIILDVVEEALIPGYPRGKLIRYVNPLINERLKSYDTIQELSTHFEPRSNTEKRVAKRKSGK